MDLYDLMLVAGEFSEMVWDISVFQSEEFNVCKHSSQD